MHSELNTETAGDINEGGFLANLNKKGLTYPKCWMELHGNSIDGNAKNIIYKVSRTTIKQIDDGNGMDKPKLKQAFSMYNSNHCNDRSIGVSGFGLKGSQNGLSNKSLVKTITKSAYGPYLTAEAPWDEMHRLQRYTGMVTIRSSTEEEIEDFNNDRLQLSKTGTTQIFQYHSKVASSISQQFETPETCELFDPINQLSVVFGLCTQVVSYEHFEMISKKLECYNYFDAEETDFYTGPETYKISCMEKNGEDDHFILHHNDGHDYEIKTKGLNRYATSWSLVTSNYDDWTQYGEFDVFTGTRRDPQFFNDDIPQLPGGTAVIHPYDKHHIGDKNFEWLSKIPLRRNGQLIGVVELTDIKISSARGNGESMNSVYNTHCEIRYNPISTIDNKQDMIACVQECKTTCVPDFPIPLVRLIQGIKRNKAKKVWQYFETKCKHANSIKTTPVENTPVENTPVENTPVEITPVEITPVENTPVEITPVEITPVENTPVENAPVEIAPVEIAPMKSIPVETTSVEIAPMKSIPVETTSIETTPIKSTPVEITPDETISLHISIGIEKELNITKSDVDPVDVYSHRRGGVLGSELQEESLSLCSRLIPEKKYTDEYIQLLNLLRKLNALE
jgi:hypothetical protein